MKTISIKQPWAWFICSFKKTAGLETKRIENRSTLKHIKGMHLIHAGQQFDQVGFGHIVNKMLGKYPELAFRTSRLRQNDFPMGGIVGWADFTGEHVTKSNDFWFEGPNGLLIRDAGELDFIECKGALSIFDIDYPHPLPVGVK